MWKYLFAILFFLAGIPVCNMGIKETRYYSRINNEGVKIEAVVTETRYSEGTGYEVRYRFRVDNRDYTFADSFERTNLWATVPQETPIGSTLTVLYVPSDPWLNRPLFLKTNPLADTIFALIFGIVLIGFGIFLAVSTFIGRKKQKAVQNA